MKLYGGWPTDPRRLKQIWSRGYRNSGWLPMGQIRTYIEMAFANEITCHENIRLLFRRPRRSKTNITHFWEIIYLPHVENVPHPATSSRIYITYSYTKATIKWRNEDGKLADRLSCSSSFSVNFCVATTVTLDAEIPTGRMINWNHFGIFAKRGFNRVSRFNCIVLHGALTA